MLIVCDTNVLVSALLWTGTAAAVRQAWLEGRCVLALDASVLDEYRRVLSYRKFPLSAQDVAYLIEEEILPFGIRFPDSPGDKGQWIPEDPDDDRFIRLALRAEAACIVSGDSHLLAGKDLPVPVLDIPGFLVRMEKQNA